VDPPVQPEPVPVEQVLRELVGAATITRQLVCAPRFKAAADLTYGMEGFGLRAAGMAGGAEPPWWTTAETRCAAVLAPAAPASRSAVDASTLRAYVERFLETAGTYEILYYDPAAGLGLHAWVPAAGQPFCPSVFERSSRTGTVTMWTALPSRYGRVGVTIGPARSWTAPGG
jgi:hypothetical protein